MSLATCKVAYILKGNVTVRQEIHSGEDLTDFLRVICNLEKCESALLSG